MGVPAQKYPEILEDLAAKLAALLIEENIEPDRARNIAFRHAEQVRRDWGGQKLYIPIRKRGLVPQDSASDSRVWLRTLAELVNVFTDYFARTKTPTAQGVVIVLASHFGGRMMYLPRGERLRIALRDIEIVRNHDDCNVQSSPRARSQELGLNRP